MHIEMTHQEIIDLFIRNEDGDRELAREAPAVTQSCATPHSCASAWTMQRPWVWPQKKRSQR
jgi:hypothetical protein